jgi:hypothetical protein
MDPAAATGQIRVAIIGDGAAADIALPTTLAIRELIPRIRATLASGRDDDELPPEDASDGLRPYSLAPLGGTPFSLDATLETLNINDGEQLILRKLPPVPAAPPVVEDIADASAIHSARQFKPFTHQLLPAMAQVVVLALGALVCGLALDGWRRGYQWWAAGAQGVLTVILMAATVQLRRRRSRVAAGRMGATTVPLALAPAASLPGDGGSPRLPGAAGLVAGRRRAGDHQHLGGHLHRDHRRQRDRGDRRFGVHACPPAVLSLDGAGHLAARGAHAPTALWCGRGSRPTCHGPGADPAAVVAHRDEDHRKTAISVPPAAHRRLGDPAVLVGAGAVVAGEPALLAWLRRHDHRHGAADASGIRRFPRCGFRHAVSDRAGTDYSFTATGHPLAGLYAAAAIAGLTVSCSS